MRVAAAATAAARLAEVCQWLRAAADDADEATVDRLVEKVKKLVQEVEQGER